MKFNSDPDIQNLLSQKHKIEEQIQKILLIKKIRFSHSKFVGDLGEYYLKLNLENTIFQTLDQSKASNFSCDFLGIFKNEFAIKYGLSHEPQRIEVKTRKFQKGKPHLFGLNTSKFDILAFVALNEDYSCNYIGLMKNDVVKPDNQNRIAFCNSLKFWPDLDYKEF